MVVPGSVVEEPAFGVELFGIEAIGCAEAGGVGSAGLTYQTFPPRAVVEVLVRHSRSIGHILHMAQVVGVVVEEDVRGLGMVLTHGTEGAFIRSVTKISSAFQPARVFF
ncbi:hypothetical protein [Schleiferia thermophila]|uniref:hypothetical protein n=1 Tax=Schleiferia thermophila TaxID=884107 RepID=UPI000FFAFA68|nr:hypothetical protein [Schleiferia thermophila]GCD80893.1 hypothetical protein JCM30197_21400 [Schleiferia thermophila]